MEVFDPEELKDLHKPDLNSSGEQNGSIVIIGGSSLFHGAPILALKVSSRIVDMVYFAPPEKSVGSVAEQIKSKLMSFIWVPWEEVEAYIEKSDAVLIGPGMMRFTHEQKKLRTEEIKNIEISEEGRKTREITQRLLEKFPDKKWVIDAGSLQVMDADWIPQKAILTPNFKEFEILFGTLIHGSRFAIQELSRLVQKKANEFNCIIVLKGPETIVASPDESIIVRGGNPGLTKGGTGDVLAGLTVALLAKNDPFLAACSASYIEKRSADELYKKVGTNYNADDLTDKIPEVFHTLLSKR